MLSAYVRPSLVSALLVAVLLLSPLAADGKQGEEDSAAAGGGVVAKQGDLKSLRSQIEALRREMAAAEGSRKESADQLKGAEQAISATQRDLHQLREQIATLQATLTTLEGESQALASGLSLQQAQLEELLYRQYLRGNPDALQLFLNGDDSHQLARDLYYMEAIGRARRQLLVDIESKLRRQQALAADSRQQAAQLAAAEAKQREEHAKLLAQRVQRQATLDGLAEQIAVQRREIGQLQRDEKRLSNLIDRLSKIIAAKAAEARREALRREAQQRREVAQQEVARQLAEQEAEARQQQAGQTALTADDLRLTNAPPAPAVRREAPPPAPPPALPPARPKTASEAPPAEPFVGNLAKMKGSLRLPTRGAISNQFGGTRQEGSTWKGLFIRAGTGSEVHSIAAGRVVFAEWMRGFGNLMIVDHGSDYLSVYANNDSLLKDIGDDVRGGENIATVGNTGGNPESGLYFEIRHQGKPLDPLAWVRGK